jgi:hypothetical protein
MNTAVAPAGARLPLLGQSGELDIRLLQLHRECYLLYTLFFSEDWVDELRVHSLPLDTHRSMIQWPRFAFEPDIMIPMKNGQSGRDEMLLCVPPSPVECTP